MFKQERGITLVALVVTIVVLLILAGVSLSLVLGNGGLIQKAKDAKAADYKGYARDIVSTALKAVEIDDLASSTTNTDIVQATVDAIGTSVSGTFSKGTADNTIKYVPSDTTYEFTVTIAPANYTVSDVVQVKPAK